MERETLVSSHNRELSHAQLNQMLQVWAVSTIRQVLLEKAGSTLYYEKGNFQK